MTTPDARVGVDVGGTFTDVVAVVDGRITVVKVPSTPADQAAGVLDGVERLGGEVAAVARFVHGTTVATNAVLERTGARTVLVTTEGFRDLLEIGRQDRPSLYDLSADRPAPLVPRDLVVVAPERLDVDGRVVRPLDDPAAVAEAVRARDPEAVAVCLLYAFVDDRHERAVAESLAPTGVPVSRSSVVLPVFREYERASTTVLNAYVAPVMGRYLASLDRRLDAAGLAVPVEVMRSGGGTFTAEVAGRSPVETLLSGPAAGAWGAAAVGRAAGADHLIAYDVGGTSTDVSLVERGRPTTTSDGSIDGLPFGVPTTDVHTVGAGGGSVAWRDAGGALRVGPRSAGAVPGPACYGGGGTEPTVTDANVVLGRITADTRLGGRLPLRPELAHAAMGELARALDLSVEACAEGIVEVVEAHVVRALRVVSVERGRDPRDFALVPFGGAGPLHQSGVARALGCRRVLVPPHAGVLSALGLLTAPVTIEEVRTHHRDVDQLDVRELRRTWDALARRAADLVTDMGSPVATQRRAADLRYRGQAFELTVDADAFTRDGDLDALVRRFHAAHDERYGYRQPDAPVELVNLRVRCEGPTPELPLPAVAPAGGAGEARIGTTRIRLDGRDADVPVLARDRLGGGGVVRGPAVLVAVDSTVLVAAWQRGEIDDHGILVLEEAT